MELTASVIKALRFASEKHRHQRRKDRHLSPYINHLIEVLHLLWETGGIREEPILVAGLLHDTLEDTATVPAEIERLFGGEVRKLVEAVTDDKSLPKAERKRRQVEKAASIPPGARVIKLADKCANLKDLIYFPPADWPDSRRREYVAWANEVINQIRDTNAPLEAYFDQLTGMINKRLTPVE